MSDAQGEHREADEGNNRSPARVVVGVDGSESSLRALRWAAREARLRDAPLEVVTAWAFPERSAPLGIVAQVPWQDDLLRTAQAKLDEVVAATIDDDRPTVLEAKVIRGAPAEVLLAEAGPADLLVVGNRAEGPSPRSSWGRSAIAACDTPAAPSP